MSLLTVVLVLIVIGIVLWAINSYLPMDGNILKLLNIVVLIVTVVWLLKVFGIIAYLSKVSI